MCLQVYTCAKYVHLVAGLQDGVRTSACNRLIPDLTNRSVQTSRVPLKTRCTSFLSPPPRAPNITCVVNRPSPRMMNSTHAASVASKLALSHS